MSNTGRNLLNFVRHVNYRARETASSVHVSKAYISGVAKKLYYRAQQKASWNVKEGRPPSLISVTCALEQNNRYLHGHTNRYGLQEEPAVNCRE